MLKILQFSILGVSLNGLNSQHSKGKLQISGRPFVGRIGAVVASSALLAGGLGAVTTTPAQAVPNFTNITTTNGLGDNYLRGVFAAGSTVYAATQGGLSISTDGGTNFTSYTTTNSLGSDTVYGVYAVGSGPTAAIYAATVGGLSISTNGGTNFTNYTTTNGLGSNAVRGVFAAGSTVYAATQGGLSISLGGGGDASASTETRVGPADVIQQVGRPTSGCENLALPLLDWAGVSSGRWKSSWAEWVNGGRGGSVCTRTLAYSTNTNAWECPRFG